MAWRHDAGRAYMMRRLLNDLTTSSSTRFSHSAWKACSPSGCLNCAIQVLGYERDEVDAVYGIQVKEIALAHRSRRFMVRWVRVGLLIPVEAAVHKSISTREKIGGTG